MALALCHVDAAAASGATGGKGGASDEAAKTLQRAYELAAANNLQHMVTEVAALQVGGCAGMWVVVVVCGGQWHDTCWRA